MLYGLAALVFGLAFPIIGVVIGTLGLAPPGEDPWGPGLGMIIAGPCTALFYLPTAVLGAIATRRLKNQDPNAQGWAIACAATTLLSCAPAGAGLLILTLLKQDSHEPAHESGD